MELPIVHCSHSGLVDPKNLKPHPRNPNRHPPKQIEMFISILEYSGWRRPITVSKRSGYITKGHGAYEAAIKAGYGFVPVDYQNYSDEEQEMADIVADNMLQRMSEMDVGQMKEILVDLNVGGFNMELTGIQLDQMQVILQQVPDDVTRNSFDESKEDEIPDDAPTRVKRGDIWQLGDHRLMCGDSTDALQVERLMDGQKADLVFTDPPYKLETEGGCKGVTGKALKKQGKDIEFISEFDPKNFLKTLPSVFENKKMNAYVFCNKELLPDYLGWAKTNGYSFNVLIWKKPNAIPIGDSHRPDIEYMLLFRKSAIWNNAVPGINYSRCLEYGREKGLHPTMKPVELISNELEISSNKDSVVVDFFSGSGSTLIACEKTGRKCFGMEIDPHYCDIIIERWERLTGRTAEIIRQ